MRPKQRAKKGQRGKHPKTDPAISRISHISRLLILCPQFQQNPKHRRCGQLKKSAVEPKSDKQNNSACTADRSQPIHFHNYGFRFLLLRFFRQRKPQIYSETKERRNPKLDTKQKIIIHLNGATFSPFWREVIMLIKRFGLVPAQTKPGPFHHHLAVAIPSSYAIAPGKIVLIANGKGATRGMPLGSLEMPEKTKNYRQNNYECR